MKKSLSFLVILLNTFLFSSEVFSLPNCVGSNSETFNNCFGIQTLQNGQYEGEFKNGKFHGQGTVYWPDGITYEGEFKQNEYDGQATYTYEDGTTYIGEYKNDKKHGIGTQTYPSGGKYEGEWQNGEHNGIGTETFSNGKIYFGEFKDGKAHGFGTFTTPEGQKFVGEFEGGLNFNEGVFTNLDSNILKYVGQIDEFLFNGLGIITFSDGSVLEGVFKNGDYLYHQQYIPYNASASGSGWKCNSGYEKVGHFCRVSIENGYWSSDGLTVICSSGYKKNGLRSCIAKSNLPKNAHPSGSDWKCNDGYQKVGNECQKESNEISFKDGKYVGELKDGVPHGLGTYTAKDGSTYLGLFKNGRIEGEGTYTHPDGTIIIGEMKNDEYFSDVTVTYPNGDVYIGGFKVLGDSIGRNGQGIMFYVDGSSEIGIWKNNEFQYTENNSEPNNEEVMPASSGSGFAVSSNGYIVTNHHVIDGCNNVEIIDKGRTIKAHIVSFDVSSDIALLKADYKPKYIFPLRRKEPFILMEIYVAGYPFGYDLSTQVKVTKGIVSSLVGVGNNFAQIQIDAAIQPGNSGGPIVDNKGNVVGVAVSSLDAEKTMEVYGVVPEGTHFGVKSSVVINLLEKNNINLIDVNTNELSKETLGKTISDGTYYISCLKTAVYRIEF